MASSDPAQVQAEARTAEPSTDDGTQVVITVVPYDHPDARRLVDELNDEIDDRYRYDDDSGSWDEPDVVATWAVHPSQMTPPSGTFLVAYLGGRAVGCGALRQLVPDHRGRLRPVPADAQVPVDGPVTTEIKRLYVAPEARGRGVSRALMAQLEQKAAEAGYHRIQLETGERQPEAINLYESTGWRRITPYGQFAEDPLSVCFVKELQPEV